MTKGGNNNHSGAASMKAYAAAGFKPLAGFQLRYIYFLNQEAKQRLTVPVLPFSKIDEMGAGMYKGEKITRTKEQALENPSSLGGATPTCVLQTKSECFNG